MLAFNQNFFCWNVFRSMLIWLFTFDYMCVQLAFRSLFFYHLLRSLSNRVSGILVDVHASQILISSIFFFIYFASLSYMCCQNEPRTEIRNMDGIFFFLFLSILLFNFFPIFLLFRACCRQIYYTCGPLIWWW